MDDEIEPPEPLISRAFPTTASSQLQTSLTETASAIVSKPAQRAYINTALFALSSSTFFCISVIAYWIFYYNYVPQIGLERLVHLQFGDGHPYGTATLGAELIPAQQYDVSVALYLPRTPSNLAAGNFMLDLSLFSQDTDTNTSPKAGTSTGLLARSRRPAILTYASPIVDTAKRVSKMPLYLVGWQKEAERLRVGMMERVEFERKKNMPKMLRLEIQSEEKMQVYRAVVKFDARFSGLRWIMYNWRILSFLTFSSTFWVVSMVCTSSVWIALASQEGGPALVKKPKREIKEDGSDISVKEEEGSEDEEETRRLSSRRERRLSSEAEQIKKEEDIEESTMIQPLVGEGETEVKTSGSATTGPGRSVQRRRGHIHFEDEQAGD
ncbi:hypothetical protein AJ79_00956 [Helicocarpus griseus UAMH5409]|uniref:Seipin n=1 Tax=Helicocarpus griseus UAMH5409 TaxID=1447875 RepID=A0A2B7Y990_9EURO|nr:hypothetical protein AJ79_00956 [Helicocarpus griseus UAMH5409]